jgi:small-conductance mechanosensitive channel
MWQNIAQNIQAKLIAIGHALSFAPPWALSLVLLAGTVVVAWLVHAAIHAALLRLCRDQWLYPRRILDATENPTRLAFILIALAVTSPVASLGQETDLILVRLVTLATICMFGWIALTVLHIGADLYLLRFRIDVADNLLARKHVTQVRVLVRVIDAIIILLTVGFALMSFEAVRQYGVSLFASAGVAGIVAGLAARPVFSNLLAGVQLAMAQPIRIDDAVIVENEWGNVEEITFTYIVVRLWDLRRMVVPLSYFIEKPFQNWTRTGGELIGSVLLYVDHTAPVDAIRKKLGEIAAQSKSWNGKVVSLQVTACNETTIELRGLVSANNASAAWDLRCEVREKLIDFLQREYPDALPRRRNEIVERPPRKDRPQIAAARPSGA